MSNIHPSAIIEEGAKIDPSAKICAYTFVSKNAKIGANVVLHQGSQVCGDTHVGEGTEIYPNAVVGGEPQDVSYTRENAGKLVIGKNNKIREFATINIGTQKSDGYTRVGDNCTIMAYVHIAHDCILRDDIILANGVTLAGHIEIESHAVVGGLTPIHQFVHIGEGAMVAGASALSQDVPPFTLVEGNRATIKSLNLVGIKRRLSKEDMSALSVAFKKIFRNPDVSVSDSINEIIAEEKNKNVIKMCEFIKNSKRGIAFSRKGNE